MSTQKIEQPYQKLERKYANFCGRKFAISCNTGTSALHLALLALGVGKGDEVILPDFTFASCGFAVSYCGAVPVFVDCGDDLNLDVKLIESKITKKTKIILGIDIYGRLCNWKEIHRIAKKHKLKVIEDAAECQLPKEVYKSKADITCYSFYENKIIHAEEGGICTTNNKKYADKMNYYKNMCFDKGHTYFHKDIGYNYRMPNSQALLALKSLKNYPKENIRRRKIEKKFYGNNWLNAVWVLPFDKKGDRPFFKPLSSFPCYGGKCQSPVAKYFSQFKYKRI